MPETKSALLLLPRELRDRIYEYLLTETFIVMNPDPRDLLQSVPFTTYRPILAILRVSKSTRDEAKSVLYRHGRFSFYLLLSGAPLLHQEIHRIPCLEQLQDVTIWVETREEEVFRHDSAKVIEYGTALINHFAGLDSGTQRKRCVIQVAFFSALDFVDVSLQITDGFKDAIGRLTRFRFVKLKITYYDRFKGMTSAPKQVLDTLYTSLDEMLAMRLGKGEQVRGRRGHSWIYHPQQV